MLDIQLIEAQAAINQTLNTTVNISNTMPEITVLVCPSDLDLEAYGNKTITCNVTVYDYNNNTLGVNATFYYYLNDADDPDNKNIHYTNVTCGNVTVQDYEMNFTCGFEVAYFANNGTWYVNATAFDIFGSSMSNISNAVTINPLIAIYIPSDTVLDFGELSTGDISADKLANITNAGNMPINLSVSGWAVTKGDGLAMNCTYGSINRTYQRYEITAGQSWSAMNLLPISDIMITDFHIAKTTNQTYPETNSTFWKIWIPPYAGGICNGKLLFTAGDYE
ncbi:hypothetical protein JXB41_02005 [Candidatus Woesearchaeota archaeon]|nr:hypothetical protein [Candidatus Woesearchaeota archaeon]